MTVLICVLAAVSQAAAPLPKPASAYTTSGYKHGLSITFVISTSGKKIEAGSAAAASEFAMSGGAVQCPKAKRSGGLHEPPFVIFGFPGASLKLAHGKYGFSKSVTQRGASLIGSSEKPFTLRLKISGAVVSPTVIAGTVKVSGGPCTAKKPISFKAKFDPKVPVAPGQ